MFFEWKTGAVITSESTAVHRYLPRKFTASENTVFRVMERISEGTVRWQVLGAVSELNYFINKGNTCPGKTLLRKTDIHICI